MADETAINGVDGSVEVFVDSDETDAAAAADAKAAQKIEALEQEKRQLIHENDVVRERLERLKEEIKGLESDKAELKREVEQSGADKRSLESISAMAHALETEVSRLKDDLITRENAVEESGREIVELRREVEGFKERASRAEGFEKERDLLLERVGERENEVGELKKVVEEKKVEVERLRRERDELEGLLEAADRKGREVEEKVGELCEELEARQKIISGMKASDSMNRSKGVALDGDVAEFFGDGEEKGLVGLKGQWPVVAAAAATGVAIGAGAVLCYVRCARER